MYRFLLLLVVVSTGPLAYSQDNNKDVTPQAVREIQRRGNYVQETGTIRADEQAAIADAFGPPADDSHKWFLTLVTKEGDRLSEKLKADFIAKKELQAWVDVDKPEDSFMHYQVRRVEDVTQRDWLKGLKPYTDKGIFPLLVIQPPKNGQYGPGSVVVKVIVSYDGDAAKLSTKIRDSIGTYVTTAVKRHIYARRSFESKGFEQSSIEESDGVGQVGPPPFPAPKVDPFQPNGTVPDWPPSAPSQLSPAQLMQLCPGAPASFIAKLYEQKVSDPAVVQLQYAAWKEENPPVAPKVPEKEPTVVVSPTPAQPTPPTVDLSGWIKLLLGSQLGALLMLVILRVLERYTASTPSTIDDRILAYLKQMVEGKLLAQANQTAPKGPSS